MGRRAALRPKADTRQNVHDKAAMEAQPQSRQLSFEASDHGGGMSSRPTAKRSFGWGAGGARGAQGGS